MCPTLPEPPVGTFFDETLQLDRRFVTFGRMFAIIKTGGKQYKVIPGQKLKIEKLDTTEGAAIHFGEVLLVADGDKVEIGAPTVKGANVDAKVLKQGRARKLIVFKYHPKSRYRKKKGHRQHFTEIEITRIAS